VPSQEQEKFVKKKLSTRWHSNIAFTLAVLEVETKQLEINQGNPLPLFDPSYQST